MSANTKIEWCDHTFNPWEGCTAVGPGCDHCYAEARNLRFNSGQTINWGPGAPRRRTSAGNWRQPLRWNAASEAGHFVECSGCGWRGVDSAESSRLRVCMSCGTRTMPARPRVFCASLADVFDNEVPAQWRAELFALIQKTPHLDWLLLTKRVGNVTRMLADISHGSDQDLTLLDMMPLPNVWIGATVVSQDEADRDIPKLMRVPAWVHFLSIEPMLGPIDLKLMQYEDSDYRDELGRIVANTRRRLIRWVICGGESGPHARPMHPDWARSLRDQCAAAGVTFLFKQWGEWVPRSACYHTFANGQSCADIDPSCKKWPMVVNLTDAGHDGTRIENVNGGDTAYMQLVGKKTAGRLLDGAEHNGFPGDAA